VDIFFNNLALVSISVFSKLVQVFKIKLRSILDSSRCD